MNGWKGTLVELLAKLEERKSGMPMSFIYTNYKGETCKRHVVPSGVFFGTAQFHEKRQWLFTGYDRQKEAIRVYAVNDIESGSIKIDK